MTTSQVFIAGARAAGHVQALAKLEEAVAAYPKPLRVVTLAPAIMGVVWAYTAVCDVVEQPPTTHFGSGWDEVARAVA